MYCHNCGAQVDGDDLFCSKCGTKLTSSDRNAISDAEWERCRNELKRNKRRGLFLFILIFPIIYLYINNPRIGMMGILIWVFLMIVFFLSYLVKKETYGSAIRRRRMSGKGNSGVRKERRHPGNNKNVSTQRSPKSVVETVKKKPAVNFMVKTVASYALGKTAMTAMDKTGIGIPKRNQYSDKYVNSLGNIDTRAISGSVNNNRVRVSSADGKRSLYITTMPNGSQDLCDAGNRRVGHYDAIRNETTDGRGRCVGKGNLLHTLK